MQKIYHKYAHIHPVFDEIDRFYTLTSEKNPANSNALIKPEFDFAFVYLQDLFNEFGECDYNFTFVDKEYKKLKLPKMDSKNIIVLFSGGKDSTATAVHYKNLGYNVYLYHVRGINKSYPDEWKSAENVAKYLNLPIHFEDVEITGKLDFVEHPMKNIMIATGALNWGIQNNIGVKIAPGNYWDNWLAKPSFYFSGDDAVEMWMAYEEIIRLIIPKFRIYLGLKNFNSTLKILSKDKELLALCQSCIGAQRFRAWNHDINERKYHIKLLPNRCGSCWKCASEYIYMSDHDVLEYNADYYKHCLEVLKKHDAKENQHLFINYEDLWTGYFQYNIKQSKYLGG